MSLFLVPFCELFFIFFFAHTMTNATCSSTPSEAKAAVFYICILEEFEVSHLIFQMDLLIMLAQLKGINSKHESGKLGSPGHFCSHSQFISTNPGIHFFAFSFGVPLRKRRRE